MSFADVLGSVFGGGVTGLVGVVVQRVYEYKTKQLEIQSDRERFDHEIAMKHADADILAQEWAGRTKVAEVEASDHQSVADSQAFAQALTSEPQRYSDSSKLSGGQEWLMVVLDVIRGLIRPVLTLYLCAITTVMYIQTKQLVGNITAEQAGPIFKLIIETVLYLTTTCTLFWFGSRNKEKRPSL